MLAALHRLFIGSVGLLVGGSILALSVPRTVAEISLLTVGPIRQAVQQKKPVLFDELVRLHETQMAVLSSMPSGPLLIRRSATESAIAKIFPTKHPKRSQWDEAAESSTKLALLHAPANSYAWMRLAFMRLRSGSEDRTVGEPMMMSVLTGAREISLLFTRIGYAIRVWDQLSEEDIELIEDQILWADRVDRKRLIAIAKRNRNSMMIVFAAIARDLNQFRPFIRAFNQ